MSEARLGDQIDRLKGLSLICLRTTLHHHWPEYLIEAFGLGVFMMSAGIVTYLLYAPAGILAGAFGSAMAKRGITGIAMGATAVAIIYSPWGRRSGAHLNPAVTLAFYRLGKISAGDAVFYMLAQAAGGIAGVCLTWALLGEGFTQPPVRFVVTVPGFKGPVIAAVAEFAISLGLMLSVLITSNRAHLMRYTGLFSGVLIALYVTFESPLSGMSMNPARTLASALPAFDFSFFYLYLFVPPAAMLLAVELYAFIDGHHHVPCAKLNHETDARCIFYCDFKKHGVNPKDLRQAATPSSEIEPHAH